MKKQVIVDINADRKQIAAARLLMEAGECEVLGFTVSWGENPLDKALEQSCALAQDKVPVYAGCPGPLARHLYQKNACLPKPVQMPAQVQREHAVSYLIRACRNAQEPVTLVQFAPLTNIGMALRIAPDIAGKIQEILIVDSLRKDAYASENLRRDPEAAQVLIEYGVPLSVMQLEAEKNLTDGIAWWLEERNAAKGAHTHIQMCIDRGLGAGVILRNGVLASNGRIITEEDVAQ